MENKVTVVDDEEYLSIYSMHELMFTPNTEENYQPENWYYNMTDTILGRISKVSGYGIPVTQVQYYVLLHELRYKVEQENNLKIFDKTEFYLLCLSLISAMLVDLDRSGYKNYFNNNRFFITEEIIDSQINRSFKSLEIITDKLINDYKLFT